MSDFLTNRYLVLLNGPPGSGKDTAADAILENFNARKMKIATPLKEATAAIGGLSLGDYIRKFETKPGAKDEPAEAFGGFTAREINIAVSEGIVRELAERTGRVTDAETLWGRMFVSRMRRPHSFLVTAVSDCGFQRELSPIMCSGIKPDHVLLLRIYRPGKSFEGDSRERVTLAPWKEAGATEIDIHNVATVEVFKLAVVNMVSRWIGEDDEDEDED